MTQDLTNAIAIIGMSGRFPGASDITKFWDNLQNGVSSIRDFTKEELIESGVDPIVMDHPNYVNKGAPFEDSDKFDANFFGYLPKQAELMDPQHRVLLEIAWSALEHAGYDPDRYAGLISVFTGIARNSYLTSSLLKEEELNHTVGEYTMMIGNERDFPATRVAFKMNLKGPAINVTTACSTSGVAIHLACQSLLSGDSDMAMAGAARVINPRLAGYWYTEGGPLARDGNIRAFSADANGMLRGTGGAIVVLKRYEDAVNDGDTIHAIIRGSAINNDGSDKIGYSAPSVDGQAACIADAIEVAGVPAETISYIETHGTGTIVGDPIEVAGLTKAFRETTDKKQFCAIGSVKTNIGHLDAGATVAGVVKTVLAMNHQQLPASLNFTKPNPQIDFENSPFFVNAELRDWQPDGFPRRAGVSSFGLGGTNVHIIIEEAPKLEPSDEETRPFQLLPLSAKTSTALDSATQNLATHLKANPDVNLADVAFTLQNGRQPFNHRRFVVASDVQDAISALEDSKRHVSEKYDGLHRPVVFMFPGGGTQYAEMGRGLYESEPIFREMIDECAEICQDLIPVNLLDLIYEKPDAELLKRPSLALPALLSIEIALAHLWEAWGLTPDAMIGHSMGEYAAAYMAGVFSLEDALALVACRGRLFEKLPSGSMLGVPLSEDKIKGYTNGTLDIAAINKPDMSVISGETSAIESLQKQLENDGIESRLIHIDVAAHSRMVEPILQEFAEFLEQIRFETPELPFVSNVTGQWVDETAVTKTAYWVDHLRHTVRFADGLNTLLENPSQILLEVGPGRALSTFARQHPSRGKETAVVASLRHPREAIDDVAFTLKSLGQLWLAGASIDWEAFTMDELRIRIPLPTYPFERKRFWITPKQPMVSLNGTMPPDAEELLSKSASQQVSRSAGQQVSESAGQQVSESAGQQLSKSAGQQVSGSATQQLPNYPITQLPNTPIHQLPNTPITQSPNEVPMSTPDPRNIRLEVAIKEVIQDLSGIPVAELDSQSTFLELGFDSLFLTQANSALKKKFKVKLSVRQLLEKYGRIDALAEYIDSKLPADAFPAPEPVVSVQSSVNSEQSANQQISESAGQQLPNYPITQLPNNAGFTAPSSTIEKVIQDQLTAMQNLMAQQLAMLGGNGQLPIANNQLSTQPTNQPSIQPTNQPISQSPNTPVHQSPSTPTVDKTSPWQPVQKGEDGLLPPKQQKFLEELIAKTVELHPNSKALAQKHRAHLADPRTVQGFKKSYKEMVFPITSARSKGSKVWDIDGNEYIDLIGGYGVNLLGHSPDFVSEAAKAQIDLGIDIGPQNKLAGEVAKMICDMTGMDRAAMCNTGSEAILAAIRIARTITGNDKIAMFKTHYHGIFNEVLVKGINIGGRDKTLPIAPGIPGFAVENTIMLDYGEMETLNKIRENADDLALVMVESVRSRDPEKRPHEFIKALRALTTKLGIPLMFDEIVTGFRAGPGGAQEYYGVQADLASYGKIIGGGYPIGVIAGKKEYMDALDGGHWQFGDDSAPEADMTWFAGTFVRHPLAMATAHATLTYLKERPNLQKELNERVQTFVDELNDHFKKTNAPVYVTNFASWFVVKFEPYQAYSPLLFWHLRNKGILTYEGRPAFFTAAHTKEDFAQILQAFKEAVADMQNIGLFPGGPVRDPNEPYEIPMTEGQQEIWLATRFGDDASRAYNLASTLRLKGNLDEAGLETAVTQLIQRHEALRAVPNMDGLNQTVYPIKTYDIRHIDLSGEAYEVQETRLEELKTEEVNTPFDLDNGPLTRAKLIKLSDTEHFFIFTAHHIIADGWSCGLILKDIGKLYTAVSQNQPAQLNDLMQLSEWADLQIESEGSEEHQDAKEYWLEEFKGDIPILELPTDRPRPAVKTYAAKRTTVVVDKAEMAEYSKLASSQGVTLFTYLMAGFDVLLHRITNQDDIVVGFSLAGQSNLSGQDLVAHAVNFLPIRAKLNSQTKFSDLLQTLRGKIFDAMEYQDYPFGALIKNLKLERDRSRLPLMSVAFNLDPSGSGVQIPGLDVSAGSVPRTYENFDIFFNVAELGDRYEIQVTANQDLFDSTTIERHIDEYLTIIRSAKTNPDQLVGDIPLLSAEEKHKLLVEWNRSDKTYASNQSLIELFEAQAEQHADKIAVSFNDQSLTYAQLNEKANQLARHLHSQGVHHESLVGLSVERSLDVVVGILGILKAGGTYVPLDPANPTERLAHIIEDSGMDLLVAVTAVSQTLPPHSAKVVNLDSDADIIAEYDSTNLDLQTSADSMAYIIYTSGSTGKPKGVMVDHKHVVRLFSATQDWYNFSETDVWTLFHSYAFDFSVWELWGALLYGGELVVVPYLVSRSPEAFYDLLNSKGVSILNQTPSAFRQLIQAEALASTKHNLSLREVIFGGEALELESLRPWFERHGDTSPRLVNMYGITETTVHVTYRPITLVDVDAGLGSVIGIPIPDLDIYILDEQQQPVPIGVPGEIYVGGDGVSRGYLNRPELNAEKFVDVELTIDDLRFTIDQSENALRPANSANGEVTETSSKDQNRQSSIVNRQLLYRSGDLARYLPNRDIEYLGRIDNQVQIRGFRVELGEIETAVTSHKAVQSAVVTVDDQSVTAYVVPSGESDAESASEQHKSMWLDKWEALYESGRSSANDQNGNADIINDLAILDQLATGNWEEEMREFQGQTIDRVLALKPKRILEIGCGSGQNLVQIAPHVDYFKGTDYAPFAIEDLQKYLANAGDKMAHVEVETREGSDFSGMEANSFDTTVILSVMQYFPSPDYFKAVIEGSLKVTQPGGVVYISDVQSFAHLETHHAADQFRRSADDTSLAQLQAVIQRRVANEDELVVDPNYFEALKLSYPEISHIEFKLRRGHLINETTQFHYDVFIYLASEDGTASETAVSPTWLDWQAEGLTLDSLKATLNSNTELLCLTNVVNGRIQEELAIRHLIQTSDSDATISDLKAKLGETTKAGVDPEAIWALADELGLAVNIRWTENAPNGTMDIIFSQPSNSPQVIAPAQPSDLLPQAWRDFANKPMMKEVTSGLIPTLRRYLKNKLPDYMIPNHFVIMDSMPLTNNGKVNKKALPAPTSDGATATATDFSAPVGETEQAVSDIWTAVLGIDNIGRTANFFEIGGHSLLAIQVIIKIRERFGVEMALGSMFEFTTIAGLATRISALQASSSSADEEREVLTI